MPVLVKKATPSWALVEVSGHEVEFQVRKGIVVRTLGPRLSEGEFTEAHDAASGAILKKQEEAERERLSANPRAPTDDSIAAFIHKQVIIRGTRVSEELRWYFERGKWLEEWRKYRIGQLVRQRGSESSKKAAATRKASKAKKRAPAPKPQLSFF